MFELKLTTWFAGAHQLKMVGEKCENLHGHNWRIEVYIRGNELDEAGVLVDFGEVKKQLRSVINMLDHRFLNEHDGFGERQPTSENIAVFIADHLTEAMNDAVKDRGIYVSRVSAWESENACATYYPRPPANHSG